MSLPVVASLCCRAQVGLEAPLVQVEVTVTSGLPAFQLVGLPATVVRESRDRVRSALLSAGFEFPSGRIVVNLAPAEIPKEGGRFELPIAVGIRAASHLQEVCRHVTGEEPLRVHSAWGRDRTPEQLSGTEPDVSDVRGQFQAKRALLIAAAGDHSLLMIGPPGCGKTMLAQRLPGLLPPLTATEALDCAAIASVSAAGFNMGSFGRRPFRSPHHTASAVSVVGGGAHARPGEISLAHHGVLFLDELPEFDRQVLEALREPLEAGIVRVARAAAHADYPAEFQLIAAMNPCPCGHLGDPAGNCRCPPIQTERYRARISGPLLDRLDMHIHVPRLEVGDFDDRIGRGESSAALAARVTATRSRQLARQGRCNGRLTDAQIDRCCILQPTARTLLDRTMKQLRFSGRTRQRILKLARTIADLDGRDAIADTHVSEAVMLRCLDRERALAARL